MKKYNVSEIMKRAWDMKKYGFYSTIGEAIKSSWAIAKAQWQAFLDLFRPVSIVTTCEGITISLISDDTPAASAPKTETPTYTFIVSKDSYINADLTKNEMYHHCKKVMSELDNPHDDNLYSRAYKSTLANHDGDLRAAMFSYASDVCDKLAPQFYVTAFYQTCYHSSITDAYTAYKSTTLAKLWSGVSIVRCFLIFRTDKTSEIHIVPYYNYCISTRKCKVYINFADHKFIELATKTQPNRISTAMTIQDILMRSGYASYFTNWKDKRRYVKVAAYSSIPATTYKNAHHYNNFMYSIRRDIGYFDIQGLEYTRGRDTDLIEFILENCQNGLAI